MLYAGQRIRKRPQPGRRGLEGTAGVACPFPQLRELGLAELMRSYGQRSHAGQEVRLVDLPGDAGQGLGCWEKSRMT